MTSTQAERRLRRVTELATLETLREKIDLLENL